ncbi:hypothetical protein [Caulobacter segnis]|uniref:Uncharacterized protein n=1 Tax=Caulobacter segnis TaxID=88688 RepID=A0A2W5VD66_9CAUL|nr:hypothetical protein [Caulobacter segnis]PZR37202.1 MAG: hypothetical protein DI526_01410 [Caulobacter segnis]
MSDSPANKSDGSPQRVAFDLWEKLSQPTRQSGETQADYVKRQLKVFEQCLKAAYGRPFDTRDLT